MQNRAFVRVLGFENRIGGLSSRLAHFPNANAVIRATRQKTFAIRAKDHGVLLLEWLREGFLTLTRRNIPQFHRAVGAGAGENFSVRSECEAVDAAIVAR